MTTVFRTIAPRIVPFNRETEAGFSRHMPLVQTAKPMVVTLPVVTVTPIIRFPVTVVAMANFWMMMCERGSWRMNHPSLRMEVDAMVMDQCAAEDHRPCADGDPLPAILLR